MATLSGSLAERTEIHKSCKTLESVVNVLNDYCEAANAIVQLQKKLAKALRESASAKCAVEVPANALNASATIFEAMAEVDSKFAKFADKECDNISTEVKKWFKKLAKEERTHDEKIASADQKIKKAGQLYERKAKKYPRDAIEEHTRYMNLISALGPEVNREKYNHALLVTQKHTSTMYALAASLSRVADAEWMRGCESVRRFSPSVGNLGQWKALCEGGWSGSVPPDLPGGDAIDQSETSSHQTNGKEEEAGVSTDRPQEPPATLLDKPAPEYSSRNASEQESTSRAVTPSGQSPVPPPQYFPPTSPMDRSPDSSANPEETKEAEHRNSAKGTDERSATLAAFPAPPTHFPIPPVGGSKFGSSNNRGQESRNESTSEDQVSAQDSVSLTPFPRFTESPIPDSVANTPALTEDTRSPPNPHFELYTPASITPQSSTSPSDMAVDRGSPHPVRAREKAPPSSYVDDADFGVRRSTDSTRMRTADASLGKVTEQSDTGKSTGSMVAALRDRYARGPGPSSPPPQSPHRELPKLPNSVSNLANRYEPVGGTPTVSRQPTGSPTRERVRTSVDTYARMPEPSMATASTPSISRYSAALSSPSAEEITLRRQRIEELEELEWREREHELRMKEREIEHKTRELERERLQIVSARGEARNEGYNNSGIRAAGAPRLSTTKRPSIDTLPSSKYPSSYSRSTTHLVPPVSSQSSSNRTPSSQPSSPASQSLDHAPYCGCEACSASKYKTRDMSLSPRDLRPPEPPIQLRPEKARGGWIRRLSMPVIPNAFSLDSKKNGSNAGIAGGPGYRNSMAFTEEDGRLHTDLTGGIRNRSSTNVVRR